MAMQEAKDCSSANRPDLKRGRIGACKGQVSEAQKGWNRGFSSYQTLILMTSVKAHLHLEKNSSCILFYTITEQRTLLSRSGLGGSYYILEPRSASTGSLSKPRPAPSAPIWNALVNVCIWHATTRRQSTSFHQEIKIQLQILVFRLQVSPLPTTEHIISISSILSHAMKFTRIWPLQHMGNWDQGLTDCIHIGISTKHYMVKKI